MIKNAGSRVFYVLVVASCAVLCLIAIISFGSFADAHNKFRKIFRPSPHQCILFLDDKTGPSTGHACTFSIWGEVFVALLALLLGVAFIVKTAIGVDARSCFSVVELTVIVLTGLLDFAVAITISIGMDQTCDALKSQGAKKCSEIDDLGVDVYHKIRVSEATAWIGTLILALMTAVHIVVLLLYIRRHNQKRREENVPYGHLDKDSTDSTDSTDPEESKTNKPVAI